MADQRVIAVVGPTATGKSDLAVALAQRLDAEIVNADSMQLYAGMDIGTAKLRTDQRAGVPHHLLDIWPITKSAAVAEYQQLARDTIAQIHDRGRLPLLVGGSGLYLRGALDRLEFPGESPQIRARLYAELDVVGASALHARLTALDPAAGASILPTNGRRIVRALEVIELTGRPFVASMPAFESVYDCVQVGLDRDDLDDRVERRVDAMMDAGLLEEVRAPAPGGPSAEPDGRQGPRLRPAARLPRRRGRGGGRRPGRRRGNRAGHPALRAPAAFLVSARPPGAVVRRRRPESARAGVRRPR